MKKLVFIFISCLLLSKGISQDCGKRNEDGVEDPNIIVDEETKAKASDLSRDTFFGEWPHMCAVQRILKIGNSITKEIYLSGGSLIAPNVVLTAAHYVV